MFTIKTRSSTRQIDFLNAKCSVLSDLGLSKSHINPKLASIQSLRIYNTLLPSELIFKAPPAFRKHNNCSKSLFIWPRQAWPCIFYIYLGVLLNKAAMRPLRS